MLFDHGCWKTLECLAAFLLFSQLVLEITEETYLPVCPSSLQVCFSSNAALFFLYPSSSVISSMTGNSRVRFGPFAAALFFFLVAVSSSSADWPCLLAQGVIFAPFLPPLPLSLSLSVVVLQLLLLLGVTALFLSILGGGGQGFSSHCSRLLC